MKKIHFILLTLFIALGIGPLSVEAGTISPTGKKVGQDKSGNAIYQVDANGIKIGYKLIGSGEPLVMIAGLSNTMDEWPQAVIDDLCKKYQLIILDNRGMGYTTSNDTPFSYQLFAVDVIGLLDALKVEKAHVLGFSMGSTITQKLLIEYPQRFNKAIICATLIDGTHTVDVLKRRFHLGAPSVNPTVLRQMEATTQWKTPMDKVAAIPNQVLLIVGTLDTVVGPESSKTLAGAIPGAWLVQFKNGTHGLIIQSPNEFAKVVLTFLEVNEIVSR